MANRLIKEKSPYLLQHAHNPVDWYSWSEEAFLKAKAEDKPIFLSIGYSTCYWCHVMEREVFENEKIAVLMNNMFINIKVDREERPDVDRVYMAALQAMTGSGGWPMSMFLTPDLKPFYGATYIPPQSKFGMPGFEELITEINNVWMNRRSEVLDSGEKILEHLQQSNSKSAADKVMDKEILDKAIQQFKMGFDNEYGGFGNAPKFPRPSGFNFLLRIYYKTKDDEILRMVIRTLTEMANGGIYDHIGGGFHRYSVDKFWRVPHFEKMLYDQAQTVNSYLEVFQLTNESFFLEIAEDILKYVTRNLYHSDGGFYSAQDAESALSFDNLSVKEEGAFYVWEKKEINKVLGENAELFCYIFGVYEQGNAPAGSDPHNVFVNKNILYKAQSSLDKAAGQFNKTREEINDIISDCKLKLLAEREKRPTPYLDDKILTSWNGLMITAFANAFKVTGKEEYLNIAKKSADFILEHLVTVNGTLLHRWRENEARFEAGLDDYVFFVQGILDLYEASFDAKYINYAVDMNNKMIDIFYDHENYGFFDTSANDNSILYRTKNDYDSAEPAGNSVAVMNLIRLSEFLHNENYLNTAKNTLMAFSDKLEKYTYAMPQMLCALDFYLSERLQLVISGPKDNNEIKEISKFINSKYLPSKIIVYADPNENVNSALTEEWKVYLNNEPSVYICRNYSCLAPVHSAKDLKELELI